MAGEGNEYKTPGLLNNGTPPRGREFQIPLNTAFTEVFGLTGHLIRKYKISDEEKKNTPLLFEVGEIEADEITEDQLNSPQGMPVNFWMKFAKGTYNKRMSGDIKQVDLEDMYLPFASVATFTRAKRYTETYMSGGEGSVIEEYGFEPWDIRIQGFVLRGEGKGSIENQVKEMQKWENLSDAIEVEGRLFQWLGIHKIAFTVIDWKPERRLNLERTLPFEIKARSVKPIELVNI
jgi:hypothetical protein